MIDIETPQEIEVVSNGIDVEARSLDVEVVDLKELDVTVAKREFVITGDDIYVPKLYDDAPQWMKDLVQIVVNSAIDTGNASTLAQLTSMLSQFATSYVPLNQYTQSILDLSNEDASIHAIIETLNSNYSDGLSQANAQIVDLQNTKASKEEVVAQVVSTLAAQLASPTSNLGAAIGNLQQTIVDNQNANALSMQTLTASLDDVSGQVSSNAEIVNNALAYVGINEAGASTGTGLSAYVQGSNGVIGGADSNVANSVYVDAQGNNYSKWAYNSTVSLNGVNYNSGFGLSNSTGTGIGSEFWINADKLKFTNNGKTGSKAPFTIDASGSTPQITFNGIVSFSNITGYTPPDISGSINNNNDVFAQKLGYANYQAMVNAADSGQTVVNGGHINTGLIQAGAITTGMLDANAISGKVISGGIITGTKLYGTQIEGAIIKASYIDLSSTSTLTNWQQYTPATYPSSYDANFAKNNNGTLLVDSQGYVRLMGNTRIVLGANSQASRYIPNENSTPSASLASYELNLHSYDDYKYSSINRCINKDFILSISSSQVINFCTSLTFAGYNSTQYSNARFYINTDYYELYASWTQGSTVNQGAGTAWIKKNNVTINSTSWGSYGNNTITYIVYFGNLPITLSSGGNSNSVLVYAKTATLGTSTSITGYSGVYDSLFKLDYLYSSRRWEVSYDTPAITII